MPLCEAIKQKPERMFFRAEPTGRIWITSFVRAAITHMTASNVSVCQWSTAMSLRAFVSLKPSFLFAEKVAPSNGILELLHGKKAISMR